MIRIMVDIDGVLVDWLGKFTELYNKKAEQLSILDGDIHPMGVLVDYDVTSEINGLNQEIVAEVLEEIDEIKGVVNKQLAHFLVNLNTNEDVQVEVVSARTRHLDATYKLMTHLGFQQGHIILGMKHKEDIAKKYDIIIEDSPYLHESLLHKTIMPSWSYNWHMRDRVLGYSGKTEELVDLIWTEVERLRAIEHTPKGWGKGEFD